MINCNLQCGERKKNDWETDVEYSQSVVFVVKPSRKWLKTHKASATARHTADKLDWSGHIEKNYYHGL